jgi:hypothetical protein
VTVVTGTTATEVGEELGLETLLATTTTRLVEVVVPTVELEDGMTELAFVADEDAGTTEFTIEFANAGVLATAVELVGCAELDGATVTVVVDIAEEDTELKPPPTTTVGTEAVVKLEVIGFCLELPLTGSDRDDRVLVTGVAADVLAKPI